MTRIASQLLDAYLKCPTKCWLRSVGEQATDSTFAQCAQAQNESYGAAETRRLLSRTQQNEFIISPSPESLKSGKWRLAVGVLAKTPHLESYLHALERLPPERRGKPAPFIAIRFVSTNKINKEAKLML